LPEEPDKKKLNEICREIMASDNIVSREWVYRQYDTEVGLYSTVKSGQGDGGVFRLSEFGSKKGIAATFDGNSHHCYLDPYKGGAGVLMEACCNVAAVGGEPIAFTDCLNFGNPEHPKVFWTFEKVVEGIADAAKALDIPCVGGNVSFYNHDQVNNVAVKPSPVIFAAGLIEDVTKAMNNKFKAPGEHIILIGETKTEIGGSEYTRVIHQSENGEVPTVDFTKAKDTLSDIVSVIDSKLVTASHDLSKGGLFVALTEMAMAGDLGYTVDLMKVPADTERLDIKLFSETHVRFLVTTTEENLGKVVAQFAKHQIPATLIGKVTEKKKLLINNGNDTNIIDLPLEEIKQKWKFRMEEEMEGKIQK